MYLVYYTKNDMQSMRELMKIVRSSSSLPIFMPPTYYQGEYYIDGGVTGGIALDIAKKDGFEKYFVVLSQKQGKAFLVYPNEMPVTNKELNYEKLSKSYEMGYEQGKKDLPKWKAFLGLEKGE
jgi:predicted patatin/cPLA2 family phospholipase